MATSVALPQIDTNTDHVVRAAPSPRSAVPSRPPTPTSATFLLKEPDLLSQGDFQVIQSKTPDDQKSWRSLYNDAHQQQKRQEMGWINFESNHLKSKPKYEKRDFRDMSTSHDSYVASEPTKKLADINKTIREMNEKSGQTPTFGQVKELPFRQPCLQVQDHWEEIFKNPQVLQNIAPIYSFGYALQRYYNARADDPETFDTALLNKFRTALDTNNEKIDDLDKREEFGFLSLPAEGGGAFRMPGAEDNNNDEEDVEMENVAPTDNRFIDPNLGDGDVLEIPEEIQNIRSKIGGHDGLLQRLLWKFGETGQVDSMLLDQFNQVNKEIEEATNAMKASGTDVVPGTFNINFAQLQFVDDLKRTSNLFAQIKNNPGDKELRREYAGLRRAAKEFLKKRKYPDNFLEAFVPSVKDIVNAYNAANPAKASQELQSTLAQMRSSIEGRNGSLNKYLYSSASGQVDGTAEKEIVAVNAALRKECADNRVRDEFSFDEEKMGIMLNIVKSLKTLENDCVNNPQDERNISLYLDHCKIISDDFAAQPGVRDALIGSFQTSEAWKEILKQGKEKPIFKRHTRAAPGGSVAPPVVQAPPRENVKSQFMRTGAEPGQVREMVHGELIYKTIDSYRRVGFGHQLLLKYLLPGYSKPAFEFVPASKFKGSLDEFKATGGKEFKVAPRSQLNGALWSKCGIGGIAPGSRNEFDAYSRNVVTHILLTLDMDRDSNDFYWFRRTDVYNKFGDQLVTEEDRFLAESGQGLPKKPLPKLERERLVRNEIERRERKGLDPLPSRRERDKYGKAVKQILRAAETDERHGNGSRGRYGNRGYSRDRYGKGSIRDRYEEYYRGYSDEEEEEGEPT